jgi:hypothetical protein
MQLKLAPHPFDMAPVPEACQQQHQPDQQNETDRQYDKLSHL